MNHRIKFQVTDMHTGAEPVRIVTGGFPELRGATILERRQDALENHDHLRTLLMREPRGHAEMYGVILTAPVHSGAAMGAVFMHNGGYSTMCGHATIALGRFMVDMGMVEVTEGTTRFFLECPCGLVEVRVEVKNGQAGVVSFESVAAYLHKRRLQVSTGLAGNIEVDIAYGGAYYALVSADQLGLDIRVTRLSELKARAIEITDTIRDQYPIKHPTEPELGVLYGTIVTEADGINKSGINHHLCWFGDGQLDRSPTGSGVTARLATAYAKGEFGVGDSALFAGISGDPFHGRISRIADLGDYKAVHTEVSGHAWYSGTSEFVLEEGDFISKGYHDPDTPGQIWNR